MHPTITDTFLNESDGVEGIVAEIQCGFSASLRDVESGLTLDTHIVYPVATFGADGARAGAIEKAKELAGIVRAPRAVSIAV